MFNFDEASRKSKETMDGMLKSYSEIAKGFQAIATEAGDYSRKSFQDMTAFMDALVATRSIEAAYELQTSYVKSACESFFAEAGKMSDMYADLAKSAYRPYEKPAVSSPGVMTASAA